ncbi:N-acetylneuraminate epimerase [Otariodibacter oris]|uniref:N-acetylneuraminate epimerase n=1 Tax=Otariodibacter oris TaxID=1032623 RepID=A0A420XJ53_9PAST|nr:N-acetylneuraminate epimerase [Otariodibacter oris]QGM80571.1 N-acetylneuraminic acid mutarotase [Otariodibacter oris]RKR77273.1 N-acetylneuraminate epimerase [Otariodibacter oris]
MKFTKTALFSVLAMTAFAAQAAQYPDLPEGIKSGTGAVIGDTVYVGLGGTGTTKFYSLDLKDPKAWKEIATFPGGDRNQPISGVVDGKLYVFGGYQKNAQGALNLVNDAYSYDPVKNEWTKLETRSPRGLVGASAATRGDKIYVLGGSNFEIFDGIFNDLTAAGDDSAKKDAISDAYFNQAPEDYFFTTELLSYQPAKNKWTNEGQGYPRAGAMFSIDGDNLMVVNGEIKPGLRTAATYQGTFGKNGVEWKQLPDLPGVKGQAQDGLAGAMGGYSNGRYIVTGGANFPGSVKQFNDGMNWAHKGLTKTYHNDIYAFGDGKWSVVGEYPMNIAYGVAVNYGDKVLMIGGETDGGKALTEVKTMSFDGDKVVVE